MKPNRVVVFISVRANISPVNAPNPRNAPPCHGVSPPLPDRDSVAKRTEGCGKVFADPKIPC